jgi:hypothetical protein
LPQLFRERLDAARPFPELTLAVAALNPPVLTAARAYVEKGLALYDPAHRLFYAELLANDMLVQLLVHSPIPLVCLGFIDQALSRVDAALAEARRQSHPINLAIALTWAWITGWCIRAEPKLLLQYGDENLALSAEHGLGFFRAWGLIHRGWCLAALGHADKGLPLQTTGLGALHDIGFMVMRPLSLTVVSDACRMGGEFQRALEYTCHAQQIADQTQELMTQAETLRLHGDLLRCAGDPAAAEGTYGQALSLARHQSAKLWELRAATKPRPPLAQSRQAHRSPRSPRAYLQLVHRRARHTGTARGEGIAGAALSMSEVRK